MSSAGVPSFLKDILTHQACQYQLAAAFTYPEEGRIGLYTYDIKPLVVDNKPEIVMQFLFFDLLSDLAQQR
jgi:hypothetical protein